jgi:hypothetical protein
MERLCEVQLPRAGKAAGFVFEADGVGVVHGLPVTYDGVLAALEQVTGGEPVGFFPIDPRCGGEQALALRLRPHGHIPEKVSGGESVEIRVLFDSVIQKLGLPVHKTVVSAQTRADCDSDCDPDTDANTDPEGPQRLQGSRNRNRYRFLLPSLTFSVWIAVV